MLRRYRITTIAWLPLLALSACQQPAAQPEEAQGNFSIRTNEILDRCVAAYAKAQSLTAVGTFRDFRTENRRVVPVRWDLARPGKCRVQLDMDVAVVVGDNWWVYEPDTGQFKKRRAFTRTPMETAGYLMSHGVSFLTPAAFMRGEAAFGKSRTRGYIDWKMLGIAWLHERPCYVVTKSMPAQGATGMMRVWIDQDSYLVRGWDIVEAGDDGRERTILSCMYHELRANPAMDAARFELTAPTPLGRPPEPRPAGPKDSDGRPRPGADPKGTGENALRQ